ncbi:MAG: N-acetylneuraminate synthase family protein [Peptococcaceae bacterium]|nr:N-acetylneuraminate synthase family protein [Peptococcaceae bacterium]
MFTKPLFIFELANNHSGRVAHAKRIISELREVCVYDEFDYAVKLQYRDLNTFITEDAKVSLDNAAVTRFMDTRLSEQEFLEIRNFIGQNEFKAICTPFDEVSVDVIERHNYDYIKIASCSLTDWSLLERIALTDKLIIASTAASSFADIDRVVQFFAHRKKRLALMHCVGEYPTPVDNLQLNQLDMLGTRYIGVPIGYSTHERPESNKSIAIAVSKGARLFEKHVGVATDSIKLNAYSATPSQARAWLDGAREAYLACGVSGTRHNFSEKEKLDLWQFRRGVFAKEDIPTDTVITNNLTYYAIPKKPGQLTANDMSKYNRYTSLETIKAGAPVRERCVNLTNIEQMTFEAYAAVKKLLGDSGVTLGKERTYELSHHYGIERFFEYGAALIEVINRSYCKKIMVLLPAQKHPVHYHKIKEESFHILYGTLNITIDGISNLYHAGDVEHIRPGQRHSFSSDYGCVFEEVSTTHFANDSYYDDAAINSNSSRKTKIQYQSDISD